MRVRFAEEVARSIDDFEDYTREAREEYLRYEAKARAEYNRYANEVKRVWGTDSIGQIVDNSRTTWVEYSDDFRTRSVVDFEHGAITVEVALDEQQAAQPQQVDEALGKAVQQLLQSRGTTCPYESEVDRSEPLTQQPVLEGLIDFSAYRGVADEMENEEPETALRNKRPTPPQPTVKGKELALAGNDAPQPQVTVPNESMASRRGRKEKTATPLSKGQKATSISKEKRERRAGKNSSASQGGRTLAARLIAEQSAKRVRTVKGDDGTSRQVVSIQMTMVTDNLSRNAALYKDLVAEFSARYQVEQPLIFAVIEQESYFNPEAASWVPAYGLMQLVPQSGGRHAYRYVYGKDWSPTRSYLVNPRNNIELGTAYLRVLLNQFGQVANADCRRLCAIASYNTGAGNVSRSFTGGTSVTQALPYINQMDYNTLYGHLTTRLAYSEARNYVVGVTRRMAKYVKQ